MSNPFMDLSPAEIDVLDDMLADWRDKLYEGDLKRVFGYGSQRIEAVGRLSVLLEDAWKLKVRYAVIEDD